MSHRKEGILGFSPGGLQMPQNTHTPMNLANKITTGRIILTPFFIAAVIYNRFDIALIIFALAILSDGIDGFIARTLNQKTQLGTVIDPIADKLLLVSAFIVLSTGQNIPAGFRLPAYVPLIVISRDVLIILGSVIIYFMKGDLKIEPSVSGKLTTFFQMMTIVSVLTYFRYSYIVWNVAVAFTVVSGISYLVTGSRMANGGLVHQKTDKKEV